MTSKGQRTPIKRLCTWAFVLGFVSVSCAILFGSVSWVLVLCVLVALPSILTGFGCVVWLIVKTVTAAGNPDAG